MGCFGDYGILIISTPFGYKTNVIKINKPTSNSKVFFSKPQSLLSQNKLFFCHPALKVSELKGFPYIENYGYDQLINNAEFLVPKFFQWWYIPFSIFPTIQTTNIYRSVNSPPCPPPPLLTPLIYELEIHRLVVILGAHKLEKNINNWRSSGEEDDVPNVLACAS